MKYLIISILLSLSFFGFSQAEADSPLDETFSQLNNAKPAIWKVHYLGQYGNGTGFFIGPNRFITNFRIVSKLLNRSFPVDSSLDPELESKDPIHRIVLSQEEGEAILKIKKALAVSVLYDLILLETEANVTNYLSLKEGSPKANEDLFLIAYSFRGFTELKKTGDIFYEDDQRYEFPVNSSFLYGIGGGPVLDGQGLIVGVAFLGAVNILSAIKVNDLKEFITGNIGSECSGFNFTKACIEAEVQNLKELAGIGSVYAQDKLALMYYENLEVNWDFGKAFRWFKTAAEQGYAPAQYSLSGMYAGGEGVGKDMEEAFRWLKKAAEQDFVAAQYSLGLMYDKGVGVDQDFEKAFQWMKTAAEQSYTPAQYQLTLMYVHGRGTQPSLDQAFYWCERAAEQGFAPAQEMLDLIGG